MLDKATTHHSACKTTHGFFNTVSSLKSCVVSPFSFEHYLRATSFGLESKINNPFSNEMPKAEVSLGEGRGQRLWLLSEGLPPDLPTTKCCHWPYGRLFSRRKRLFYPRGRKHGILQILSLCISYMTGMLLCRGSMCRSKYRLLIFAAHSALFTSSHHNRLPRGIDG